MSASETTCKWCGKTMPYDPGSYYHKKRCEADWCSVQLKRTDLTEDQRKRLIAQRERAYYVGD